MKVYGVQLYSLMAAGSNDLRWLFLALREQQWEGRAWAGDAQALQGGAGAARGYKASSMMDVCMANCLSVAQFTCGLISSCSSP